MANRKRARTFTITAVPYATSLICIVTYKDTPMWLLERLFPDDEKQIQALESSIYHLAALNYFATLAAKRQHEQTLYVAKWLEKAFKIWRYVDNAVRHSFMRKQIRLAECLIRDEGFELSLHYLGVSDAFREFYDAIWPQVEINEEEAAELRLVIDSKQLNIRS